ncbi:MAG: AI-2E family transporter [Opitutales bacterium]|nr:AI-2E family transporter [Opitutales bacterium]
MITYLRNLWDRHFSDPQVVILVLLLATFAAAVLLFGQILAPVFAAVVIAYLLDGLVERLIKQGVRRTFAVAGVSLLFFTGLVASVFFLLPLVYRQAGLLLQQLPMMIAEVEGFVLQLPDRFPEVFSETQVVEIAANMRAEAGRAAERILRGSFAIVPSLILLIVYLILVPFLVFFFLQDKAKILAWFSGFLPKEHQLAQKVWQETNRQLANYIRGKFWEIVIVGTVTYAAFLVLGLNFALLLAVFTGLSVLIPWVGATLMAFPVIAVAYFQFGPTWAAATVIIVYFIIQALDANVLVPILFSRVVSLHPSAIIVAVLFFGGIWGFWGVFFSIPLATLVNAVIQAWPRIVEGEVEVRDFEETTG